MIMMARAIIIIIIIIIIKKVLLGTPIRQSMSNVPFSVSSAVIWLYVRR